MKQQYHVTERDLEIVTRAIEALEPQIERMIANPQQVRQASRLIAELLSTPVLLNVGMDDISLLLRNHRRLLTLDLSVKADTENRMAKLSQLLTKKLLDIKPVSSMAVLFQAPANQPVRHEELHHFFAVADAVNSGDTAWLLALPENEALRAIVLAFAD